MGWFNIKNVVTAIGNPIISSQVFLNEKYNIVCNDIQYLEGIFEVLEIREDVDMLIVSSNMLDKKTVDEFVADVFNLKENLEIVFIEEARNYNIEKELINAGGYKLIYDCDDTDFIRKIVEQDKLELEKNVKSKFLSKEAIIVKIQMIYTKCALRVIEVLLKIIKSRKEI